MAAQKGTRDALAAPNLQMDNKGRKGGGKTFSPCRASRPVWPGQAWVEVASFQRKSLAEEPVRSGRQGDSPDQD